MTPGSVDISDRMLAILGLTPFESPDVSLVQALLQAGACGILDVGRDGPRAAAALQRLARFGQSFGVRIPEGVAAPELPKSARLVVVPAGSDLARFVGRRVLVQVTSEPEARRARDAGAWGIIAKGNEAGGRVGEESAFVLLQRLLSRGFERIWAQGGLGIHGVAAVLSGGASGVVLDAQLALLAESSLPIAVREAVAAMDGSETRLVAGHRVLVRPDIPVGVLAAGLPGNLGPGPLKERLLPCGQEGSFAKSIAERFRRVAPFVDALREGAESHLSQARALCSLGPSSPFGKLHGLRYPIAQGPMTRVSDGPAFADAVARAGGLPFLALSLMKHDDARAVLEQTRERLGALPWGVGILGFVPQELRAQQLEAIMDVRPPVALIAGGRPAQARGLEEAGIPTYLHVPSQGLMELFLRDGARRFVLEGRECGGHVGPRGSFVLWDTMVDILLRHERPEELCVLFAGGIHDARSAAMCAVLAAPLAKEGARIGVLMGTAYLFTVQAVVSGAIMPAFQQVAVGCDNTVLLESAPGHATRCADTAFADAFREARKRLEAEGRPREEVWASLEKLNLGRLRVAAKGLERRGDDLCGVDEPTQRREGMYMIGQVAALRHEVVTIEALHDDVSRGSVELIERAESRAGPARHERAERPAPRPSAAIEIAIVGMGGFYPGAADLDAFWSNIVCGRDAVTLVPEERWNQSLYYDAERRTGKTISRWGGFLPDIAFDPLRYGIPPRSLAAIEPVQLLALEASRAALEDAGYADRPFDRETTSVIFGAEAGTDLASAYGFRALFPQYLGEIPAELDRVLPDLTEDSFPGVLANVIAGRVANRLDLGGVNYTVDAACASSLAALELGCKELSLGTSSMVLCGGADLHNSIADFLMFSSVHALSPRGRSATFDAAADGIALGEGVAVVVCKRLADAERDGDRIYAVVRGIAGSSDGKSLGLTAPRKEGQMRALLRAYERAGVSPAEIGLMEAHGTGTIVGDRVELATLTEIFTRGDAAKGSVTLGSVKSNVGHTKCAAGIAGVIKVAQALHRRVLPSTIHLEKPNPAWDGGTSPFVFRTQAAPWPSTSRKAAVSAFGFGGTNFHAVLEGYDASPPPKSGIPEWPVELFLFRSGAEIERMARVLEGHDGGQTRHDLRLRDLAISQSRASTGPVQVALVASSLAELKTRVDAARAGKPDPGLHRVGVDAGRLAFLFPGQGSQRPGMMADLLIAFPELQDVLAAEPDLCAVLYPGAPFGPEATSAQRAAITDTRIAQPTLGIVELAAARILEELGVVPELLGGHSYGELVALCVAGALPKDRLVALSRARAEAILEAAAGHPGTMAACAAPAARVAALCAGIEGVVVANMNGPRQTVIAGTEEGIDRARARLEGDSISVRAISVACAFHSPVIASAPQIFARTLAEVPFATPKITVYANLTAAPHDPDPDLLRKRLAEHLVNPVRFVEQIERMYADGARTFVEVGPGRVLTGLVAQILSDRPHRALAFEGPSETPLRGLLELLGELAVGGISIATDRLFAGRGARIVDLDAPGKPKAGLWRVNGHRAVPCEGELPDFAMQLVEQPLALTAARPAAVTLGKDALVLEYLRNVRDLAEQQRLVMLSLLGHAAEPVPAPVTVTERADELVKPPAPAHAPEAAKAPVAASAGAIDVEKTLLAIVSERTGYPPDMLELDLDLEADLSIDSIKRMEILGQLAERLGLSSTDRKARDRMMEELAALKTLRGVLDKIRSVAVAAPKAPDAAESREPTPPEVTAVPAATRRFVPVLDAASAPRADVVRLTGRTIGIVSANGNLAAPLAAAIERAGARCVRNERSIGGPVDTLLDLGCLDHDDQRELGSHLFATADHARRALDAGTHTFFGISGLGGRFGQEPNGRPGPTGCGLSGLLKSVAREWPDARVCCLDLDPAAPPETLVAQVIAELGRERGSVDVGYQRADRCERRYVAEEIPAEGADLDLSPDSVVLLTGGARGITARVAEEMARRYHPHLVIVGRSPEPDLEEDPELASAVTMEELRRRIVEVSGERNPGRVEARCRQMAAAREMRRTFARLRDSGSEVTYVPLDVREPAPLEALILEIYKRHARIDAVFHGAGVNEDKLLADKTAESFARVYDTKVRSALTLARCLKDDVRYLVFFGSVAGAFGNRGQTDYAAANDSLDRLAHALSRDRRGRVVSIDWGPWGGGGMVSPELEREYGRKGIGLIDPKDGVRRLFDELARGRGAQVVLMRALPEHMG